MNKIIATVLIPTHNHPYTIKYAIASAQKQTIQNIEIFVICDGVGQDTIDILSELGSNDSRIKYFVFPKGERLGEAYRHQVLQQASGEIICYLSDDDLWMPNHVETVYNELQHVDFTCTHGIDILLDNTVHTHVSNLASKFYQQMLLNNQNRVPLLCGAHTASIYKQLPYGWRTTPIDIPTDLYMWQQFISLPHIRLSSINKITCVQMRTAFRKGLTDLEREQEIHKYYDRYLFLLSDDCTKMIADLIKHIAHHEETAANIYLNNLLKLSKGNEDNLKDWTKIIYYDNKTHNIVRIFLTKVINNKLIKNIAKRLV